MTLSKTSVLQIELVPLTLARTLWKRRGVVLALTIFGSIASFIAVNRLPNVYRSEGLILLEWQKISERYMPATVDAEVQDRLGAISQEVLSATRLQKIIDTFGLYQERRNSLSQEEIIARMRKDINVTLEKAWTRDRPVAFRVGYRGRNPVLVHKVASQLAQLFIEENFRARERLAEGTADFIDLQLQDAKKTLDQLEARLSKYKKAHNGYLPEQEAALTAALARYQIELQGNDDAVNRAQQNKLMLQSILDIATARAGTLTESQQHSRIENLTAQIALSDRDIETRNAERERILRSISDYQARVEQLPLRELEMAGLNRDYDMAKANYRSLLEKKAVAGLATDAEKGQKAGRFTMLDPPPLPEKPIGPNRALLSALGCMLSIGLGFAVALIENTRNTAVLGEWELPAETTVLGRIPLIARKQNPLLALFTTPEPAWQERKR